MSGSTVPAAIGALTAVCGTALNNVAVEVSDGPNYDPNVNYLAVGWHSSVDPAATVLYAIADAGRSRDQEDYDIACLLSFHVGTSVAEARADLYAAYELISAAIATHSKLDGAVHRARISEHAYLPAIDEGGITVSIRFNVNVIAWR